MLCCKEELPFAYFGLIDDHNVVQLEQSSNKVISPGGVAGDDAPLSLMKDSAHVKSQVSPKFSISNLTRTPYMSENLNERTRCF